jgi:hypothetical protein
MFLFLLIRSQYTGYDENADRTIKRSNTARAIRKINFVVLNRINALA